MPRILLCATTTGYQLASFREAAARLGYETMLATDRCHVMDNPWGDHAIAMRDGRVEGPVDGVVALGDFATLFAAEAAEKLGLRFHSPDATTAARDKAASRRRFQDAGLPVPVSQPAERGAPGFPCVVKPVHRSGSQGVIRANTPAEFEAAVRRVRRLAGNEPILVETFIPGREFAVEGLMTRGELRVLAIFDKPDPLDGPYFEETVYRTPSQEPAEVQARIIAAAKDATVALGLSDGPVHAEMRLNDSGVWMLEVAARPIGGLCARVLPGLEEHILRHAATGDLPEPYRDPAAVMMIPIPREGIYRGVRGVEQARAVAGIREVWITAVEGQHMKPLPEGSSYLGFIFAGGAEAERSLREAHAALKFEWSAVLPVAPV